MTFDDFVPDGEYLEHYGVKGMKWGIRKDRGPGASSRRKRTPISEKLKKRREQKAKDRVARAKARAQKQEADNAKKAEKAAKQTEKKRKDILSNPTKLYKHRKEYSADEIQNALKQFEWERKLSDYSKSQLNNGAEFIKTMFNYTNNGINLYNAAARIANSFGEENTLPYIEQPPGGDKNKKR